jgi:hypothetical protein
MHIKKKILNKKIKKENLSLFFKHFDRDFKREKKWFLKSKKKKSFAFLNLIKKKKEKKIYFPFKSKKKLLVSDNKNENK